MSTDFTELLGHLGSYEPTIAPIDISYQRFLEKGFACYEYVNPHTAPLQHLFFAHANGIPALTYDTFFRNVCARFPIRIIAYDMRGFGHTENKPDENLHSGKSWEILMQDQLNLLDSFYQKNVNWILGGHSLGSWLSYLSLNHLSTNRVILFDPPILPTKIAMAWVFAKAIGKPHWNPNAIKVRQRKTIFDSSDEIFQRFKKSGLMKNWAEACIWQYIEACFNVSSDGKYHLRHEPLWESKMFEEYPPGAYRLIKMLPRKRRREIRPHFYVGENSDTCNPRAKDWVKLFLPHLHWEIVPKGDHMFLMSEEFSGNI